MARPVGKFAVGDLAKPPLKTELYVTQMNNTSWQSFEAHLLVDPKLEHLQSVREQLIKRFPSNRTGIQIYEQVKMPEAPEYPASLVGENRGLWPAHRRLLLTIPFNASDEEKTKSNIQHLVKELMDAEQIEMNTLEGLEPGPNVDVLKYANVWSSGPFPSLTSSAVAICRIIQLNWASLEKIRKGVDVVVNFQKTLAKEGASWCTVLQAVGAVSVVKTVELYPSESDMLKITNATYFSFLEELAPLRAAVSPVAQVYLPISATSFPALRVKLRSNDWVPSLVWKVETAESEDKNDGIKHMLIEALKVGHRHIYFNGTNSMVMCSKTFTKMCKDLDISREDIVVSLEIQVGFQPQMQHTLAEIQTALGILGTSFLDILFLNWNESKESLSSFESEWMRVVEAVCSSTFVRHIGVVQMGTKYLTMVSKQNILPEINLIKCNPLISRKEILEFCNNNTIVILADVAEELLGQPVFNDKQAEIQKIAARNQRTQTQTLMAWNVQQGHAVLNPQAQDYQTFLKNFDLQTHNLLEDDLAILKKLLK